MTNPLNHKSVGIISLGCPRALVDSENILGQLKAAGYSISDKIEGSDVAVVNTCAFIQEAVEESVDTILDLIEMKKEGKVKRIMVAGCLPERYKTKIADELKEVDAFVQSAEIYPRVLLTPKHFAYLKISEGCLNKCSFCVIPYIKGRLKSRTIESVMMEAQQLIDTNRMKELIIIGQDTSMYGVDIYKVPKICELLKRLDRLQNLRWIRLLYAHPRGVTDELIKTVRESEKMCRYLDIPVEHINDRILKAMQRGIDKKTIISLIEKVRKELPNVALRTSVIVGFPGETETEFKELLEFVSDVRFEKLGAFMYSREEETPAHHFPKQIPAEIKQARFDELMKLQQDISSKILEGYIGKTFDVIIDEASEDNPDVYIGRTQYDAPEVDGVVYVKSKIKNQILKIGEIIKVKITDTYEYDLVGELASMKDLILDTKCQGWLK